MTTFFGGYCFEQTKEIYEIVGDAPFTICNLPRNVPEGRNRKTLTRLENTNYLIKCRSGTPPVYKIHPRVIARINAEQIFADPEIIEGLRMRTISYTSISITTGYSINTIKKRLKKE